MFYIIAAVKNVEINMLIAELIETCRPLGNLRLHSFCVADQLFD